MPSCHSPGNDQFWGAYGQRVLIQRKTSLLPGEKHRCWRPWPCLQLSWSSGWWQGYNHKISRWLRWIPHQKSILSQTLSLVGKRFQSRRGLIIEAGHRSDWYHLVHRNWAEVKHTAKESNYIGSNHHLHTEGGGHNICAEQRITNSNTAIISHRCQETGFRQTQASEKEVLHGASHKGDEFRLPEEVWEHFGCCRSNVAEI